MPRHKYAYVRIREPGFLGRAAAKRHRRTETRQKQSIYLKSLKSKYRYKVLQEKKTRHELNALEFQIKKIQKTLNNRGQLNFTQLFEDQERNDDQQVKMFGCSLTDYYKSRNSHIGIFINELRLVHFYIVCNYFSVSP